MSGSYYMKTTDILNLNFIIDGKTGNVLKINVTRSAYTCKCQLKIKSSGIKPKMTQRPIK